MQSDHARHDPDDAAESGPSPFRTAFTRARGESLATGTLPMHVEPRRTFEYRIEKRSRKRKPDVVSWNRLGREGWELIGLTKRHATFKRECTS